MRVQDRRSVNAKAEKTSRDRNVGGGAAVVSPGWLLRAGALVLVVALLCGYGSLCLLFYQGQWQFVLHPVRTAVRPSAIGGAGFEVVRFGPDASGRPQCSSWWLPAADSTRYAQLAILYLPPGDGSLLDQTVTLAALRTLGVSVFAIEYRGYGESAPTHPSEASMRADAEAAWSYLTRERHVNERVLIPYGVGVGAALALDLAAAHRNTPAVILDVPRFHLAASVRADPRLRILPVDLLLHDRFDLEPQLRELVTPKLILSRTGNEDPEALSAADPKMTAVLPAGDTPEFRTTLTRFLDLYAATHTPPLIVPGAVPRSEK